VSQNILGLWYLTRAELAAELNLSERTLTRLEMAGQGPPRTVLGRRRILYLREDVLKWIQKRRQIRRR
jgi:predicted DNA-binding transcriptional regulator AlpA